MEQDEFELSTKITKFETFSKGQLIERLDIIEQELGRLIKENYALRGQPVQPNQLSFIMEDQIASLQDQLYGAKSEKYKKDKNKDSDKPKPEPKPRVQKPSERYPNIPVVEKIITMSPIPSCNCCGSLLADSGMTEDSEQLTVIPKKFEIVLSKRVKYKCCTCHGDLQTAPVPAKIKESSIYSNEMIIDVVLSKYCDLIPIQRYAVMAGRSGMIDLPPHSLIELSHYFAEFALSAYLRLRDETLKSRVLNADETPHPMLEGDDKKSWYLWGFSNDKVCFFECHNTRSGDVASDILENSLCEILVSDVYSGYNKAIRIANQKRRKENKPLIKNANCHAHSRRYFFQAWKLIKSVDAEFYLDQYHEIYKLNEKCKGKSPPEILELRKKMKPFFEFMKERALNDINKYPAKHKLSKAMWYYLNNYDNLMRFLTDHEIPIDNNSQERLQRNPVVGRKTWYGTHSKRGAETAAIIFSLVESCKLNGANPREYFKALTDALLLGQEPFTPFEFLNRK